MQKHQRTTLWLIAFIFGLSLAVWIPVSANYQLSPFQDPQPIEPDDVPALQPDEVIGGSGNAPVGNMSNALEPEVVPAYQPPEVMGAGVPDAPEDSNPSDPAEASVEPELPPAVRPPSVRSTDWSGILEPQVMQTFCKLSIGNGGDDNPFSFSFSAAGSANIQTYAWDFDNNGTNDASGLTANHLYTSVGSFAVKLTCTPQAGFGSDLTVTGSVNISSSATSVFTLTPSNSLVGTAPFTIQTVNMSQGGGLLYDWKISPSSDHTVAGIYTASSKNITYTFTAADFASTPFPDTGPATFYFHLAVTDGAGNVIRSWQSVIFTPPPPKANFTVTPSDGTAPLLVTVEGVDENKGPITTWEWDFDNDTVVDATGIGPHTYTFNSTGIFPIKLTYNGPGGGGTVTRQVGVYDGGDPVQATFTYELRGGTGGNVEVCYTNTSTGPIATSEWDFDGNGTYDLTDNGQVVCHIYTSVPLAGSFYTVRLRVANAGATSTSTASNGVNVIAAPIAAFNISPGANITWGTLVSFTDASTGVINTRSWDFNGDGTPDSTATNPSNVSLTQLGANPIRLTVTGPGGSSFVEAIVFVDRLEISCDFSGTLDVLPGAGTQSYNAIIGNDGGRSIAYNWTINGVTIGAGSSVNVDWSTHGFGAFQLVLEASTTDGSGCNTTKTVTRAWQALNCQMVSDLPATLYANGQGYTFTANVSNLDGRADSYTWYVDGVLQGSTTNTLGWTNSTSTAGLPRTVTVRYNVVVDNGAGYNPPTSDCYEETTFTIQPWPDLTCNSISGQGSPLPATPDNTTRNYNYTANISNAAGRPVTYVWTVPNGTVNSQTNNQANVTWNGSSSSISPAPSDDNIGVSVTVTNPDGTTDDCNMNRNVGVQIQKLTCNAPVGDVTPVVGETIGYQRSITNRYSRPFGAINWTMERWDTASSTWVPETTGSSNPFTFTFSTPGQQYRLVYTQAVDPAGGLAGDNCTLPTPQVITVYGTGANFECESNPTGNLSPNNPGNTYAYNVSIDNGNATPINLQYRWVLVDSAGTEHVLATTTSIADGTITSPAFTLAQLSPLLVDNYTLRVDVSAVDSTVSTHTCSRSSALTVGTLTVDFSYAAGGWTNSAVPVDQQICLTNNSDTEPGDISTLSYLWDVSGNPAHNSWGVSSRNEQQPPQCISFSQPGTYSVKLTGTNGSGLRTADETVTFNAYGVQSILINRSGPGFAATTQSFTANGTNITGSYNWEFRRVSDNSLVGTKSGANVNQFFNNPGEYRATVTGSGPLGNTSAQLEFTLLPADGLTASFTASQYGGIAPLNICFTDQSISGTQIVLWEWDFDGDGAYDDLVYDNNNIPGSICYGYAMPGSVVTVGLRVTNTNFTDTASVTVRTYNLLESSASFSVAPQGAGRFCFTAQVSAGVSVTGWAFGDGSVGPAQNTVCYTYSASGGYVVEMHIQDTTTTGTVVRLVPVTLTGGGVPNLVANGSCVLTSTNTATFTVTNNGGNMTVPDEVVIRDSVGSVVLIAPLQLNAGDTLTYTVTGHIGTLTLTTTDTGVTANTYCDQPPVLTGSAACQADGTAVFTINNSSSDTAANQPYEIRDASNNLVQSGTLNVAANGSTQISVTNTYGALTFSSAGTQGATTVVNTTSNCAQPPVLTGSAACQADGTAVFTINNASTGTAASQPYEVRDASNNLVQSGTLNVPVGGSSQITVANVYGALTLTSSGGAQGPTTVLNVSSDCDQPPVLTAVASCQADGTTVFTVNNGSADTAASQPYEIRDGANNLVQSGTLNVPANGSVQLTVTDEYEGLTLTSNGGAQGPTTVLNVSSTCGEPPVLSGTTTCRIDGTAVFTITNSSGDTAASQPYEIRDANNVLVQSGTLIVAPNGTTELTVTDTFGRLTLTSSGGAQGPTTVLNITSNCDQPPMLSGSASCRVDGTAVFTITNDSIVTAASQPYEIRDTNNVLVQSGTLDVAPNGIIEVTVRNRYGPLTLTSSGIQGATTVLNVTSNCDQPPILNTAAYCRANGSTVFTIINISLDTPANQPYEVRDGDGNIVQTGILQVPTTSARDIIVTDVTGTLTLTSTGTQGTTTNISVTSNCDEPPVLTGSASCRVDGTTVFTINNTGGSDANQPYEIRDAANTVVQTGTLNVPANGSTSVTVNNVFGALTLTSSGTQSTTTVLNITGGCREPIVLSGSAMCQAGTALFIVLNSSQTSTANQSYQVRTSDGSVVQSGDLSIAPGGLQQITVTDGQGPLFLTVGTSTTVFSLSTSCSGGDESLSVSSVCIPGGIEFIVTNDGTTPLNQTYEIVGRDQQVIRTGTLDLVPGGSQTIRISEGGSTATLNTDSVSGLLTLGASCEVTSDLITPPDETTHVSSNATSPSHLPTLDLTPRAADTAVVDRPAWEALEMGTAVCPDWLIYHTNMTGDWEIFRLGDGANNELAMYDPNLSQGRGVDVTDMHPSRSPDTDYIVFTSNRDGNWELYVARVDNSLIRRMTYTRYSKDIDPSWSPDGRYVAFETDRDGNWELYLFDMQTGQETRITDHPANDINAYWTPDSQQIAFQSDRDGKWQIYLLDVATLEITKISDGTTEDHDPHVAFEGDRIAFRAYSPDNDSSVLYIMKIDGTDRHAISNRNGSALNHTWSRDDRLIAYQSDLGGDMDIYVYDIEKEVTRLVTDNTIWDYAPTWLCSGHTVVFTSDVTGDPNIYNTPADPVEAPPILVEAEANQMTFDPSDDIYPENAPSEENASREGNLPPGFELPDVVVQTG